MISNGCDIIGFKVLKDMFELRLVMDEKCDFALRNSPHKYSLDTYSVSVILHTSFQVIVSTTL